MRIYFGAVAARRRRDAVVLNVRRIETGIFAVRIVLNTFLLRQCKHFRGTHTPIKNNIDDGGGGEGRI